VSLVVSTGPASTAPKTIISLTFDDGRASQVNAGQILANHGVNGTFFINSIQLDTGSWYMSLASVQQLASAGNEIGGHTLTHPDLTTLSASDAISEICGDQQQIQAWGFPGISFAYPFGAYNSAVEGYVHSCKENGYNVSGDYLSARGAWGLQSPGDPISNTIPPQDPYLILTPEAVQTTTTLSNLEAMVTNAEQAGGGWVAIQIHSICSAPAGAPFPGNADDCLDGDTYAVTYSELDQFVAWLAARTSIGTVVMPVGKAMGGL
jgi:peptidoglycan/xylan/chitin deacetylase (PgdA/CDA1 family)